MQNLEINLHIDEIVKLCKSFVLNPEGNKGAGWLNCSPCLMGAADTGSTDAFKLTRRSCSKSKKKGPFYYWYFSVLHFSLYYSQQLFSNLYIFSMCAFAVCTGLSCLHFRQLLCGQTQKLLINIPSHVLIGRGMLYPACCAEIPWMKTVHLVVFVYVETPSDRIIGGGVFYSFFFSLRILIDDA